MDLKKSVLSFINTITPLMARKVLDVDNVEICDTDYKSGNDFPKDNWRAWGNNDFLKGSDVHFWFRASFKTPSASDNEYLVVRTATGPLGRWNDYNSQGLVYLNGKMVQGLDHNHIDTYVEPDTDYLLHNYLYISANDGTAQFNMRVCAVNKDIERLYYDIKVPYDACRMLDKNDTDYIRMMSVLVDAVNMVDFREPHSEKFYRSIKEATLFMEKEFYEKLCDTKNKPVVHCVGHTHIDVEWLWARAQTREKIQRSFSTAKTLMDRYPEYNFMLSQPELYRYLKEEAPEKYEELKELVRIGRWEPEGAMYLESDCNLTSGESLVRQILFGKRFFRKEFDKDNKILFLPDVFGYSAALPQILKKSGIEYFVTSKISWSDTNTMPYDMFNWEGIDGTKIFTFFITAQDLGGIPGVDGKDQTTYNGQISASYAKGTWDRFQQKEYTNSIFLPFGFGDGGGGPTARMLEEQRRLEKGIPSLPVTRMSTLSSYLQEAKSQFDNTCKRTGRTPAWVGELYLELHRGTYTSIAKVKKSNRYSEFLLGNVEALSVTDLFFGGSYDALGLNKYWRKTLHNQFHDILPGSSIKAVYDGTDKDYEEIAKFGEGVIFNKLSEIANRIDTDGGILLYNPTGFDRNAVVQTNGYVETKDVVPPFGWTVVKNTEHECKVKINALTVENDYYVITLDENGQITKLFDKRVQRECLTGNGNVLVAFEDYPTLYDAWEIEKQYKLKSYELSEKAVITPIFDGTRAGFVIERSYMNSKIKQTLWLYSESSRIDFETDMDWHEHHQILKATFPLNVHATSATFDVQYGHVTRPTHENTSWDKAKFETYAHKWVDVSENGYGVALLNDCKYGYSVDGNNLSITLLKCATSPNPAADQGRHEFIYSLMPHLDDFRHGRVIEESYALNQSLLEKEVALNKGTLPEKYSFVSAENSNIVITAVKKAEESEALVVRFYDAYDCKSKVVLNVPEAYKKAYLCDLMENEVGEIEICDGRVSLPVSNFEIITLKFVK